MLKKILSVALLLALGACGKPEVQFAPVNFVADGKPAKLSDWQLIKSNGAKLKLNTGVEPYELNSPLFSDYAHKLRTVWMPAGQSARWSQDQAFDFPVGTVISKTFYYPKGWERRSSSRSPTRAPSSSTVSWTSRRTA